jgi:hypothetical protein
VLAILLTVVAVIAVIRYAAAPSPIGEPLLSRQLAGAPPFQSAIQDQGNSVALPDGQTLWIFADTAQLDREPRFFVTSSAALASGTDLRLRYLLAENGTPSEFLPRTPQEKADQVQGEHYTAIWPTGVTTLPDGRILIAYAKYAVRMAPNVAFDFVAGGLFTYSYQDQGSAVRPGRVAQRFANDIWTPQDGPIASPVYADGFVYFTRCEHYRCYSVRSSVPGLADRNGYRWWTGSGWSAEVSRRAQITFGSDVPGRNPSIAWSAALKLFVMADTSGGIQDTRGLLWVARHPWGPWSRAAPFALPDCPSEGCYTVNVHPDRSAPGTLRVSFATSGIGPYVRVVDVPIRIGTGDRSRVGQSDVPQISTHDSVGCDLLSLEKCPAPARSAAKRGS